MFPEKIKRLRKNKGLSQAALADVLNITQQAVGKWEKGLTTPDYETLKLIASYFNVSTDYLLGRETITEYYHDPEVAELAEELRTNPGIKILFDASKNSTPEDIQQAADLLAFLRDRNKD